MTDDFACPHPHQASHNPGWPVLCRARLPVAKVERYLPERHDARGRTPHAATAHASCSALVDVKDGTLDGRVRQQGHKPAIGSLWQAVKFLQRLLQDLQGLQGCLELGDCYALILNALNDEGLEGIPDRAFENLMAFQTDVTAQQEVRECARRPTVTFLESTAQGGNFFVCRCHSWTFSVRLKAA